MPIAVLMQSLTFKFSFVIHCNNTISKNCSLFSVFATHLSSDRSSNRATLRRQEIAMNNRPIAPDYSFAIRGRKALPFDSTPRRGRARNDSISYKN